MSSFRERLKLLKEISGKTQAEIATDLEITPQTLSYYFNGREPNYDMLIKLAKYFDVSVDYLLGISEHKNNEQVKVRNDYYTKLIELLENNSFLNSEIFSVIESITTLFDADEREDIINNLSEFLGYYNSALLHLSKIKPHLDELCTDLKKHSDMFDHLYYSGSTLKSIVAKTSIYHDEYSMKSRIDSISDFLVKDEDEGIFKGDE